jgi:hypothetical protein
MLEGLDPWGEGESQEMQCAKDHFAIAMAIRGVNVTFDDVVVHQPIDGHCQVVDHPPQPMT